MYHEATITNWTTTLNVTVAFFYTLSRYTTVGHRSEQPRLEYLLESRSYPKPGPCRSVDHKYALSTSQYDAILAVVVNNGPDAAHTFIERMIPTWAATQLISVT